VLRSLNAQCRSVKRSINVHAFFSAVFFQLSTCLLVGAACVRMMI